jgi:hypothetical protein
MNVGITILFFNADAGTDHREVITKRTKRQSSI